MLVFMRFFQICFLIVSLVLPAQAVARGSVLVFAAASLSDVMADIAVRYQAESGDDVVLSFGGSSLLARQVEAGAPADIFISANMDWVRYLSEREVSDAGIIIAHNRLVVMGRGGVAEISSLSELSGEKGIAVGDPAHVPAGIYARQALEASGAWAGLEADLRRTGNVRLAVVLAALGAVDYAIGYASDALADDRLAVKYLIPDGLHDPITYVAARVRRDNDAADQFLQFLNSAVVREIFDAHGFSTEFSKAQNS